MALADSITPRWEGRREREGELDYFPTPVYERQVPVGDENFQASLTFSCLKKILDFFDELLVKGCSG